MLPDREPNIVAQGSDVLILWRGAGPRILVSGEAVEDYLRLGRDAAVRLGARQREGFVRNHLARILAIAEQRMRDGERGLILIKSGDL